jgi:lysozyme
VPRLSTPLAGHSRQLRSPAWFLRSLAAGGVLVVGAVLVLTALPAMLAAADGPPAGGPAAEPPGEAATGLDVSHHSGTIDWSRVDPRLLAFVYVKASEGVDLPDPAFAASWSALGSRGVPRGAYHFYVSEDDPDRQADLFLSQLASTPGELRPVVDVETLGQGAVPGDLATNLRKFLARIEAAVGSEPVIYTSPRFWDANLGPGFERYPLWVAEYDVAQPTLPAGWATWHLWQYRENAPVPGIEHGAELSRLHPELGLSALRLPRR